MKTLLIFSRFSAIDFGFTRHCHKNVGNQEMISHALQCSYLSKNNTIPIKSKEIIRIGYDVPKNKIGLAFLHLLSCWFML